MTRQKLTAIPIHCYMATRDEEGVREFDNMKDARKYREEYLKKNKRYYVIITAI